MDLKHDAASLFRLHGVRGNMSEAVLPRVAILLSTFNGERYLIEQLNGFTAQSHANWQLYWRDDGSSDRTVAMMEAFAEGPGKGRCVKVEDSGRLGAANSFLVLLRVALAGPGAFFAFSDQDDVWLPDKLANAVKAISIRPAEQLVLFYCQRALVDAQLRPHGNVPPLRFPPAFPAALTQNLIPGCCMVLNRAAAAQIDRIEAPERTWHDWWSYLVVAASGGAILRGATADILYRQHAGNLVGETAGFWTRSARAMRRGRSPFVSLLRRHVAALRARPDALPSTTLAILEIVDKGLQSGLIGRAAALFLPGLKRQTWAENLLFRLWFLLG